MYARTEDLLKIRDGEPVDASVRAAVDADPKLRAEVERLRKTRDALNALPAFEPPPGVWEKVEAQTRIGTAPRWQWLLGGAIAASVAVTASLLIIGSPDAPLPPELAPSTTVAVAPAQGSANNDLTRSMVTPTYASLVAESARLERLLNGITYQPRLVNAGTAITINGLEDRIATIDERLMYASAYGLQPRQAEALWRERVDLLNALAKVRYAQAQRFGF